MNNRNCFRRLVVTCPALLLSSVIGTACDVPLGPGGTGTTDPNTPRTVTVTLKALFAPEVASKPRRALAKELCPASPPATDDPIYLGEQDCDGDGGIIRYITPSAYKVAFKRLAFENADGDLVDVIADTGTLAGAEVLDLTTAITLPELNLPAGEYPDYYAEIYFHELTMPLYDPENPATIRVYVSDDDFPAEGSLGHHQGDITLVDAANNELGFVPPAELWQTDFLAAARGTINGAGGADPETGHLRGLYGNTDLWDRPNAMQGASQDIFILEGELNLILSADSGETTVAFTFSVQDAWFFEDFDNDQWFNPCENGTQDGCGGEWSPVLTAPDVVID